MVIAILLMGFVIVSLLLVELIVLEVAHSIALELTSIAVI
jgi:hypothetical protein